RIAVTGEEASARRSDGGATGVIAAPEVVGFWPEYPEFAGRWPAPAVGDPPGTVTNRTSTVRPTRRCSDERTCVRYLLSSHSRAKAFGTPMQKTSSSSLTTYVSLNHVS